VMAFDMLLSIDILKNAMNVVAEFCIEGITANEERCHWYVDNSNGLATALNAGAVRVRHAFSGMADLLMFLVGGYASFNSHSFKLLISI